MFLIALAVLGLGAGAFVLATIHAERVSAWIRTVPPWLRRRGWVLRGEYVTWCCLLKRRASSA